MTLNARLLAVIGFALWALLLVLLPAPFSTLLLFGMAVFGIGLTLRAPLAGLLLPSKLRLPLMILIGVLFTLSAAQFAQWQLRQTLHTATTLMLAAWVLLGALLKESYTAPVPAAQIDAAPVRTRYPLLITGLIMLGLVAGGGGDLFGLDDLLSIPVEFLLLMIGIPLVIVSLAGKEMREKPQTGRATNEKEEKPNAKAQNHKATSENVGTWHAMSLRRESSLRMVSHRTFAPLRFNLLRFSPLLLITLLAFVLRVWDLEAAVHLFVDEINFALPAKDLLEGADQALLKPFSGVFAFPYLYPYAQAWSLALFGVGLGGLRLVSAVLGTLTIPATYWLAVELLKIEKQGRGETETLNAEPQRGRAAEGEEEKPNTKAQRHEGSRETVGTWRAMSLQRESSLRMGSHPTFAAWRLSAFPLLAALLLAVFPPHIHYSRLGLNNIADPLFGVLALAGVMGGLRTGQRWRYAAGGAALGLTQYFYEGGRLIFPPLVLLWLFGVVVIGRRYGVGVRRMWVFWLAALIVAAPVYITLLARDFPLASRLEREAIGGSYWQRRAEVNQLQPFSDHTLLPLLVYVREGDRSLFYGGDQPLVLAAAVPFLLLGAGVMLWRLVLPGARPAYWLLVLWVSLVYLGNALLAISAISARYVLVFPALAILLAVGVMTAWQLLTSVIEREKLNIEEHEKSTTQQHQDTKIQGNVVSVGTWRAMSLRKSSPHTSASAAPWQFKNSLRLLFVGLVAALCVLQVDYYFNAHLRLYNHQSRPQIDGVDALFRARDLAPTTITHIISMTPLNVGLLRGIGVYLLSPAEFHFLTAETITDAYLAGLPRDVDHAFFIEPHDADTLALLRRHFTLNSPRYSPFYSVPPDKQFALYLAPAVQPTAPDP